MIIRFEISQDLFNSYIPYNYRIIYLVEIFSINGRYNIFHTNSQQLYHNLIRSGAIQTSKEYYKWLDIN